MSTWLLSNLGSAKSEDDEELGKVTLRLSVSMLARLDDLAKATNNTRTKAATGLLEDAINDAYGLLVMRREDPASFAELMAEHEREEAERFYAERDSR